MTRRLLARWTRLSSSRRPMSKPSRLRSRITRGKGRNGTRHSRSRLLTWPTNSLNSQFLIKMASQKMTLSVPLPSISKLYSKRSVGSHSHTIRTTKRQTLNKEAGSSSFSKKIARKMGRMWAFTPVKSFSMPNGSRRHTC